MPNHGQKVLVVRTPSGQLMSMKNSVVPCTGAFTVVFGFVDTGNFVVFHLDGAFMYNLKTREHETFERTDACYGFEFEIVPYNEAKPRLGQSGF